MKLKDGTKIINAHVVEEHSVLHFKKPLSIILYKKFYVKYNRLTESNIVLSSVLRMVKIAEKKLKKY